MKWNSNKEVSWVPVTVPETSFVSRLKNRFKLRSQKTQTDGQSSENPVEWNPKGLVIKRVLVWTSIMVWTVLLGGGGWVLAKKYKLFKDNQESQPQANLVLSATSNSQSSPQSNVQPSAQLNTSKALTPSEKTTKPIATGSAHLTKTVPVQKLKSAAIILSTMEINNSREAMELEILESAQFLYKKNRFWLISESGFDNKILNFLNGFHAGQLSRESPKSPGEDWARLDPSIRIQILLETFDIQSSGYLNNEGRYVPPDEDHSKKTWKSAAYEIIARMDERRTRTQLSESK